MMFHKSVTLLFAGLFAASTAFAQAPEWGQCGGINWTGETTCVSGSGCVKINEYYYQCQPGAAPAPTTTSVPPTNPGGPVTTTVGSGGPQPTAGPGPGNTLLNGWYWIRAVAPPNFHKYLQGETLRSVGPAVMKDASTAGQFNVIDGQLVQLISQTTSPATYLYGHVTKRAGSEMTLLLTWQTTPSDYGAFSFSGDTLQWSVSGINRPNNAAWLVCESQHLFVNLGPYAYQTPAGCVDQTIHYYNGATADV